MVRMEFLRKHNINYWRKYMLRSYYLVRKRSLFHRPAMFTLFHLRQKEPSPYSHSNNDVALIAQICDELTQKYGLVVSSKSRDLLLRRKKLFLTSDIASKQRSLLAQGQYRKAAALFLKHPYLLGASKNSPFPPPRKSDSKLLDSERGMLAWDSLASSI